MFCFISNTDESLAPQFPWLAYLECVGQWTCTGSFVSPSWALTAGHCADGCDGDSGAAGFRIYAGAHDLLRPEPGRVVLDAPTAVLHPDYQVETYGIYHYLATLRSDLALIPLPDPLPMGAGAAAGAGAGGKLISTVCLPPPGLTVSALLGLPSVIQGWGWTDSRNRVRPDVPYFDRRRPVMDAASCSGAFNSDGVVLVREGEVLCSDATPTKEDGGGDEDGGGVGGGVNICEGDSGGPLTWVSGGDDPRKARYKLASCCFLLLLLLMMIMVLSDVFFFDDDGAVIVVAGFFCC